MTLKGTLLISSLLILKLVIINLLVAILNGQLNKIKS